MSESLAVSSLLSQLLVAYTIECDTEFEHTMAHRTATGGRGAGTGPWLISTAMWSNFLRYLPGDGASRAQLAPLVPMVNLGGLIRWGYVQVDAVSARDDDHDVIRLTAAGVRTQAAWPSVVELVEERWVSRFGTAAIADLHAGLAALTDRAWPAFLPVVGYADGMRLHVPDEAALLGAMYGHPPATDLAARLSAALLAFTVEYEQRTRLSLTMLANVVRVIGIEGARIRDLPAASGVSKEGLASAVGFLQRHDLATVRPDPDSARAKRVDLTDRGRTALAQHRQRLAAVEGTMRSRFGAATIDRVVAAVTRLRARTDSAGKPLLATGLTPYPDCWRARRPYVTRTRALISDPCRALPHHPMVLHRGGYPDGS
jgi:DNA-binding MarR family transcriptional regulator